MQPGAARLGHSVQTEEACQESNDRVPRGSFKSDGAHDIVAEPFSSTPPTLQLHKRTFAISRARLKPPTQCFQDKRDLQHFVALRTTRKNDSILCNADLCTCDIAYGAHAAAVNNLDNGKLLSNAWPKESSSCVQGMLTPGPRLPTLRQYCSTHYQHSDRDQMG